MFSFENFERNQNLEKMAISPPNHRKTGTTICAVLFKDGVVLGADTRSTSGDLIFNKNCDKIHYIADHIRCCGAGTAADNDRVTRMISSQIELHRLLTGKPAPLISAVTMIRQHIFPYQGHIGVALILGGVDSDGPAIYSIKPHGSFSRKSYDVLGSGCVGAFSVLELGWKENMELEDAKKLVFDAIVAGAHNDLYSGNNLDICVITKDGTQLFRPYHHIHDGLKKERIHRFKPKSTGILSRTVIPIKIENTCVRQLDVEPMEVL